jgi:hypothetical protein
MALPFLYYLCGRRWVPSLLGTAALGIAALVAFLGWSSPYPANPMSQALRLGNPFGTIAFLIERTFVNLAALADPWLRGVDPPAHIENVQHAVTLLLLAVPVAMMIALRSAPPPDGPRRRELYGWTLYSLASMVLLVAVLYDFRVYHDFRTLGPYLLLVALILLADANPAVYAVIAINVAALPIFLDTYAILKAGEFHYDAAALQEFKAAVASAVRFDSRADPWCNTIATFTYGPEMLGLPPAIGMSVVLLGPPGTPARTVRSRYVLLPPAYRSAVANPLRPLTNFAIGGAPVTLWQNLSADCTR